MVCGPFVLHVGVPLGPGGVGSIEAALGCEPGGVGRLTVRPAGEYPRALRAHFDVGSWQVWGEPEEQWVGAQAHVVVETGQEQDVALAGAIWRACSGLVPTAGAADGFMVLSSAQDWEQEVCSFVVSGCLGVDPVRFPAPTHLRGEVGR